MLVSHLEAREGTELVGVVFSILKLSRYLMHQSTGAPLGGGARGTMFVYNLVLATHKQKSVENDPFSTDQSVEFSKRGQNTCHRTKDFWLILHVNSFIKSNFLLQIKCVYYA